MDDRFYIDRARHLRELAKEADPFIKKRLLRLASNYDAMTTRKGGVSHDDLADKPSQTGPGHEG